MTLIRSIMLAISFALASCATVDPAPQPVYFVVRHLHTPAGERDPDLTAEGRSAAARLPQLFAREWPAAIYHSGLKRTQQTAAPLAAQLGLTPSTYDPRDTPGLIAMIRNGPWPVLIVGHSNTVPDIIEQLGGTRPSALRHEDFGDVWRVDAQGQTSRLRIP